jgi:GTP-binding protein
MVDFVHIKVKSGKGGAGAVSFERQKFKPFGAPDGGDGGAGGDVYLKVGKDQNTLLAYRYKKNFKAGDGKRGEGNHRKGHAGEDLFLQVPVGTRVSDKYGRVVADLVEQDDQVMIAKGGKGGRGNSHVKKSSFRRGKSDFTLPETVKVRKAVGKDDIWYWFEEGSPGQEVELTLELKLLADVGLIGLPNAGKSTLLAALTAAKPKIAPYAFTTLEPNLGVMSHKGKDIVIADIPGLIEGASQGKGLGDQFLRHVERTRLLLHLISSESTNPHKELETVNKELAEYSKEILAEPQVVLLTKIDILDPSEIKNKVDQIKTKDLKVIPISAATGDGVDELKDEIIKDFG